MSHLFTRFCVAIECDVKDREWAIRTLDTLQGAAITNEEVAVVDRDVATYFSNVTDIDWDGLAIEGGTVGGKVVYYLLSKECASERAAAAFVQAHLRRSDSAERVDFTSAWYDDRTGSAGGAAVRITRDEVQIMSTSDLFHLMKL